MWVSVGDFMKIEWQWSGYRSASVLALLVAGYGLGQHGLWWMGVVLAIFCAINLTIDK